MLKEFSGRTALQVTLRNLNTTRAGRGAIGICLGIAIGAGFAGFSGSQPYRGVAAEAKIESSAAAVRGSHPVIDAAGAAALMKSTIIAIQQANQTGNYSVLRDLGTPVFRESFDQARLTVIFARLRALRADLSSLVLSMPSSAGGDPEFDANKLRLSGQFLAQSLHIRYDLAFIWIGDQWRIERLGIDAIAATEIPGALSAPPPAAEVLAPAGAAFPS
jgi:hypothetical protein